MRLARTSIAQAARLVAGFALLTVSIQALAQQTLPSVLIFELKPPGKVDRPMDETIADYLATEFDTEGKAKPIVYGRTDPVFRDAEDNGKIHKPPAWPSLREGIEVARQLGATYVMVYEFGGIKKGVSDAQAALYIGTRRVWSEKSNLTVSDSHGASVDLSTQSEARTWAMHVCTGPLKSVVAQPKLTTAVIAVGQEPKPVTVAPTTLQPEGNNQLKFEVDALVSASDLPRAISKLRDAVDQQPFDIDRRILLVQVLLDANRPDQAGEEADRAVLLAPDREDLRALAARAWIAGGRRDAARTELNQVIIRDPKGAKTRIMLAELSIGRQEPDKALENLDAAIKEHASRHAYYLRALCHALLGDDLGVKADIDSANKLQEIQAPSELLSLYQLAGTSIDLAMKSMCDDTRTIMQRAIVRPDDQAVHDKVSDCLRNLQARLDFLTAYPTPASYKNSNDHRGLAHRLLVQTMLSLQTYFSGAGQDAIVDARVDLGQALKEADGARIAFQTELHPQSAQGSGN